MKQAPGKAYRRGISLDELFDLFATEDAARQWFESHLWPDGPVCPRCGLSDRAGTTKNGKPMSHWCGACRRHFSVRMGTVMEESPLPLRKWAIAIYLETTNLKGVSSMKIHRDLSVSQKTAWFMLHRIREAWKQELGERFEGPVDIDETFIGGKARNMHAHKRKQVIKGRGAVGKTAVVGAKDRATNRVSATVVKNVDQPTLQGFVVANVEDGAKVVYRRPRRIRRAAEPRDGPPLREGVRQRHGAH